MGGQQIAARSRIDAAYSYYRTAITITDGDLTIVMNGIPLWISIFVAGLSVGYMSAGSGQSENASEVADSALAVIEADESETLLSRPVEVLTPDSIEVIARLEQRLAELEERVVTLEEAPMVAPIASEVSTDDSIDRPIVPRTRAEQSVALLTSGFETSRIDEILKLHSQHQLERLEIRDRAAREGWLDTSEFRAALRDVGDSTARVRRELDDDEFDSYLYALGLSNRVALETIIPQSEASLAGLQVGDVITAYAGDRVFRLSELQAATSGGERGELVSIQVVRGEDTLQLYLPRGPLGVTISGVSQRPGT